MTHFADPIPMESVRQPKFGHNTRTQQYWYLKIIEAIDELDIEGRAAKAQNYQDKYQKYEFPRSGPGKQTVNGISRQLVSFTNNVVSDNPTVTPQFLNELDENQWYDAAESFLQQKVKDVDLQAALTQMLWDNYYGDISWLRVDWTTSFVPTGTPTDPDALKQQANVQQAQIDAEHAQLQQGFALQTNEDDIHPLHRQGHEQVFNQLHMILPQIQDAVAAGLAPFEQQQVIEQQINLLGIHIDDHRRAEDSIEGEAFTAVRWPSYTVYYDPFATRWEDCDWYAIERVERLEDLKDRPDFRNTANLKGAPGKDSDPLHNRRIRGRSTGMGPNMGNQTAPAEMYVRYWIIHDRRSRQLIVIADQEQNNPEQKPMVVEEWPFAGDIIKPFVLIPVNDRVHGVPMIERLEFVHKQYVAVENKISEYISEVPAAKIFIEDGAIDEPFIKQFKDPTKLFCKVKTGKLPKEQVLPWNHPGIDKNLLEERARLQNELQLESGIPEVYNAGESDETATATAVRDRQAGNKVNDAKNKLGRVVEWFCDRVVTFYRKFSVEPQVVRVVSDDGVTFKPFQPSELPDGIQWLVDADSLAPTKRELERKQTLEALQVLSALFGTFIPNPQPLLKDYLRQLGHGEEIPEAFAMIPPQMLPGMAQPGMPGMPGMTPDTMNGQPGNDVGGELAPAATI